MKTGLVLEGGAMRGLFTAGVLDVLMEHGVAFDGAIGTSAGASFGCNIKSGQAGRVVRYVKRFCNDWRFSSIRSLLLTGDLYGADFAYREIPEVLDPFDSAAFAASPMAFYVTATDMDTGECVYHQLTHGDHEDIEWIRASSSMPMASRPVVLEGRKLSDGGTADSIPLRYFQSLGYTHDVVILTQPKGFVKQPNSLLPMMKVALHRYPFLLERLADRHLRYNETIAQIDAEEQAGRVLVLRPDMPLDISPLCHDTAVIERVYQHGREIGMRHLAAIQAFVAQVQAMDA